MAIDSIQLLPVAFRLARVGTDAAYRAWKRNFLFDHLECFLVMTMRSEVYVAPDIEPCGAGRFAGRNQMPGIGRIEFPFGPFDTGDRFVSLVGFAAVTAGSALDDLIRLARSRFRRPVRIGERGPSPSPQNRPCRA